MLNKKKYSKFIIIIMFILLVVGMINYSENIINSDIEVLKISDDNKEKRYVYPLGNVVGIKANTDGVLVLGYEEDDIDYIGGLKIGDIITSINDEKIDNSNDIYNKLNTLKKEEVKIGFIRYDE